MNSEDFFNNVEKHFNDALPFVVFRKPNDLKVKAMLQKDDKLNIIEDFSESGFVFAPFDNTKDAVLIPSNESELLMADYVMSSPVETSNKEQNTNKSEKEHHTNLVQKGLDAINKNELTKVVLSRCVAEDVLLENPIEILKRLLNAYATAFVYCWYHPKVGLWLGATPETLTTIEGIRFSIMALAGTQLFKNTTDVVWNKKEIDEQQIVVDYVINSLKSSVININTSKTETVKAGNLLHLKTQITGVLNPKSSNFKKLLNNLHPTPAVCGFPKEAAKQFILNNENYNREFYTGFLGELNLKEVKTRNTNRRNVENNAYSAVKTISNLFVNLRCMQLKNKKALVYVGGGITNASVPENEWQETVNKTQTMRKVL